MFLLVRFRQQLYLDMPSKNVQNNEQIYTEILSELRNLS